MPFRSLPDDQADDSFLNIVRAMEPASVADTLWAMLLSRSVWIPPFLWACAKIEWLPWHADLIKPCCATVARVLKWSSSVAQVLSWQAELIKLCCATVARVLNWSSSVARLLHECWSDQALLHACCRDELNWSSSVARLLHECWSDQALLHECCLDELNSSSSVVRLLHECWSDQALLHECCLDELNDHARLHEYELQAWCALQVQFSAFLHVHRQMFLFKPTQALVCQNHTAGWQIFLVSLNMDRTLCRLNLPDLL